jgi:hypothetical protein
MPTIGIEVDFLEEYCVDALSASFAEDGDYFGFGPVDVVADNLGRTFTWITKC